MIKTKRLKKNTISSLAFQICTIISGFVLPRLILKRFGSDVNGLVNSITQFIQVIAFLELGVGAVVQSSLYKPLAEKDNTKVSQIICSANQFFRRIGEILLVYVIILILVFPLISHRDFDFLYTGTLIAAISISSFAQYYFGVVDRLLLTADQRGYIQYTAQIITLVINTIACAILIQLGGSIHIVKLVTSLIYLARPIVLRMYVNRHYKLDRKAQYTEEPIKQKWNGIALHVSSSVLDGTDNIVLTVFSSMANVSIYSVYHLVVYGVKHLFFSTINGGVQSMLGEIWAVDDKEKTESVFGWIEWTIHTAVVLLFGCTAVLIIPFIRIYTSGVDDANYIQPLFAVLIVVAHASNCICQPYHMMIKAGGHYKETQHIYIIATITNIVISIATVKLWGLVGVAIGTLVAMVYQMIAMVIYNAKNLLKWPIKNVVKQIVVDVVTASICVALTFWIHIGEKTYVTWILLSLIVVPIWVAIILLVNLLFYKDKVQRFMGVAKGKICRLRK